MFCFCCRSEWICPRVQRLLQSINRSVVRLQSSWLVAEGFGNTQICNHDTSNIVFCLYVWCVPDCLPWCMCEGLSALRLHQSLVGKSGHLPGYGCSSHKSNTIHSYQCVCTAFSYTVRIVVWLLVNEMFNMHTGIEACNCTQVLYESLC